uniref:Uncharacterized protein n=1 Tax=Anguilla anguilla TaxID=7936 RepID=A0A0E9XAW2_ANGAN
MRENKRDGNNKSKSLVWNEETSGQTVSAQGLAHCNFTERLCSEPVDVGRKA